MKTLFLSIAIIFGNTSCAYAVTPVALTTLHAVHSLTNAEASKERPVTFEATVTYAHVNENKLFVQDGLEGIQVSAKRDFKTAPGDRVLVQGTTESNFHPVVVASSITVLRHGALPEPETATFDDMSAGLYDCMRVRLDAVIHTADMSMNEPAIILKILIDGVLVDAVVNGGDENALKNLLDASVQITGVVSVRFDGKKQRTGIMLHIASLADLKILQQAVSDPWLSPVTPMDEIGTAYHVQYSSQRTRVQGIITYYQPGAAVVLQNGSKSLWIATQSALALRIGDQAIATGYPDVRDGFLALKRSEVQDSHIYVPITPLNATLQELSFGKHQFDLVSIEGEVVMEVHAALKDEYVLTSDGRKFSAIYHHPYVAGSQPLTMNRIPLGSKVRVTGICILEGSYPFKGEAPFDILMRTPDDITVVARPSLLNVHNLILVVSLLLVLVFVVVARGWFIERKVRKQTSALASAERQRSRILEDINGSRPLAEILEEITNLVSFQLNAAPCWCQVTDGARLGSDSQETLGLRVVEKEISARTGPPLGALFAGFKSSILPGAQEVEVLSVGARLATLAIETRHLYSDLLHRSEFDRLTEIHNRFSLEKRLDDQIDDARLNASVFGLIYIDLDGFKLINDNYGHQTGDQYLQEVAWRMKRQLRPHDTLARLGGDEFAVLVPIVRSHAEVEEIAQRLERCFDEPIVVENLVLRGSASVGLALYPDDGVTKDSLLNFADTAMYTAKNKKRQTAI